MKEIIKGLENLSIVLGVVNLLCAGFLLAHVVCELKRYLKEDRVFLVIFIVIILLNVGVGLWSIFY